MQNAAATERARTAIALIGPLTDRLRALVDPLDDAAVREPCALPGWTGAHLITHLARNADALGNLLSWARTGVQRHAYPSDAQRDADIAAGAQRSAAELRADLHASSARLAEALAGFPEQAWDTEVTNRQGRPIPAHQIPWMRVTELTVHPVDLRAGPGFPDSVAAIGSAATVEVLAGVVATYEGREVPACRLAVSMPDGGTMTVSVGAGEPVELSGSAAAVLAWLTGRADGSDLAGDVPKLPDWR